MEMGLLHYILYVFFIMLQIYKPLLGQTDTALEVSFATNPVLPGGQAVLQCKVWGDVSKEQVGLSRYNNNGMNTVVFRKGDLLQDGPEHFSLDILSADSDGSTSYQLTISDVDRVTDGGLYSCYVLAVDGSVQAISSTRLDVTPEYLLPVCSSSVDTYFAESEIILTCTSQDTTSTESLIQWIRDDKIDVPNNQNVTIEDNTVIATLTEMLYKTDDGVSFRCVFLDQNRTELVSGRECSIGPITVVTNDTTVVSRIAGLTVTVFIVVIVFACIAFVVCLILMIVCCLRCCSHSSNISRSSSKSYSMRGIGRHGDSTLRREGTLAGGNESYHPVRHAPAPPASSSQQRNGDVRSEDRRFSHAEQALVLAISQSLARDQTAPYNRIDTEPSESEIIYANTNQLDINPLIAITEENEDHGVTNPGYIGGNGSALFLSDQSPTRLPPSLASAPQNQTEYYNTMELATMPSADTSELQKDDDKPVPLPKPTASNKPVPMPKPKSNAPPSKPVPDAKPTIHTNGMPLRHVPKPKPVNSSTKPVPPLKPTNGQSADGAGPAPVPPPKPNYEITEDKPTPPPKPITESRPVPPTKPLPTPASGPDDDRPAPPPKPTYKI